MCRRAIVGAWRERRSGASATARARRVLEWGRDGTAQRAAVAGWQQGSERARVRARVAEQAGGKGEREGREKERVNVLTCVFLKIFHGNSKNFEHESCSKFKFLQLSFQVKLHLSNNLKVKNLKSSLNEKPPKPTVFRGFLQISCCNLKNFEYESCLSCQTLQLLFWAKGHLS